MGDVESVKLWFIIFKGSTYVSCRCGDRQR